VNSTVLPTQHVKRVLDSEFVVGGLPIWTARIANTRTTSLQGQTCKTALCVVLIRGSVGLMGLRQLTSNTGELR